MARRRPATPAAGSLRDEAVLLRARALYRLRRFGDVVALLGPTLTSFRTVDEACTARMLHASAVSQAQDADHGLALLDDVAPAADTLQAHPAIRGEIAYFRALAHWTKRELRRGAALRAGRRERARRRHLGPAPRSCAASSPSPSSGIPKRCGCFARRSRHTRRCRERDTFLAETIVLQIASLEVTLRSAGVPGSHTSSRGAPDALVRRGGAADVLAAALADDRARRLAVRAGR